jgi:tryptophan synthase alpha chain
MLVAPTTAEARLAPIVARARGFLYCLSRTGVTGRASGYSGSIPERVAALRARTTLPIAIGFGISSAEDVSALRGVADALVVGAAFTRAIAEDPGSGAAARAGALAAQLVAALG